MRVMRLSEFSERRFIETLNNLIDSSLDANRDWFPLLIKNYKKYKEWFFVVDDEGEFVAFSGIQQYEGDCFRLLTRCYITPVFRRQILPKFDLIQSPGFHMVLAQLNYLEGKYQSVFISLEHIRRRQAIVRMATKMSLATGLSWSVLEGMFLTCVNQESFKCWQNICYNGSPPPLKRISYLDWIKLHDQ